MEYQRANFSTFAKSRYGIGVHWTADSVMPDGSKIEYAQMVERFNVPRFVEQMVDCGAEHVLLTTNHATHQLPCPNSYVDDVLPGRTNKRDLLMELAQALREVSIRFILYYHHGTDYDYDDPPWYQACGAAEKDQSRFYDNYCAIVRSLGERYGTLVDAWWFDAGYGLLRRGEVPWRRMTQAAKAGNPQRLVSYNSGIDNLECYTPYQDYWAGESVGLQHRPCRGTTTPSGLAWFSFDDWHRSYEKNSGCGQWLMDRRAWEIEWPQPSNEDLVEYVSHYRQHGGTVTFNLLIHADGSIYSPDVETIKKLKHYFSN